MKVHQKYKKLVSVPCTNHSGVNDRKVLGKLKPLRKNEYLLLNETLGGDAPKDFVQAYSYGNGRRNNPKSWSKYLAKVGHKWYPIESITEHLLNEIGRVLGLRMAESQLRMAHGQLRFLSKFFLRDGQSLTHGAEIYSACLGEKDQAFVEEIEAHKLSRELLTFQFTIDAIRSAFKSKAEPIIQDFVRMQVFDAFVGNNDRHFYNWGIIEDVKHSGIPIFSPIYDTARGLFWNYSQDKLRGMVNAKGQIDEIQVRKYVRKSMPKIGWESRKKVTHFQLMEFLVKSYPEFRPLCVSLINPESFSVVMDLLTRKFEHLLPNPRFMLVKSCLAYRFEKLNNIFTI